MDQPRVGPLGLGRHGWSSRSAASWWLVTRNGAPTTGAPSTILRGPSSSMTIAPLPPPLPRSGKAAHSRCLLGEGANYISGIFDKMRPSATTITDAPNTRGPHQVEVEHP